jgi:sterol desaturase/sphingolipid hydroxylase (fatty acid hydroxylase superfamily)
VLLLLAAAAALGAPWWVHAGVVAQSAAFGWANDAVHESFHVRGHWLRRFGWAARLTELHKVHHRDVRKNLGIFWLLPDRLFGTYEDP